jgi:4-hydroxybenzoate polyprenyltransferase
MKITGPPRIHSSIWGIQKMCFSPQGYGVWKDGWFRREHVSEDFYSGIHHMLLPDDTHRIVASGTTILFQYRASNAGDHTTGNGKTSSSVIPRGINNAIKWFVYSNLFCALSFSTAFSAAIMILLRVPVDGRLLFITFSGSMLIYSLNRHMDREEDQISLPERSDFSRRHGWHLIAMSIPLFGISLILAALQSSAVLLVVSLPLVIGVLYSVFRIKRIFLLKNLAVSLALSAILLLVVVIYRPNPSLWLPLFGIFVLTSLVNTIVFDIKDISGDACVGNRTLPVTLGIRKTQGFSFLLLAIMVLLSLPLIQTDRVFWALAPYFLYKGMYIASIPVGNSPWWYYGLIVDGEGIPLLVFSFLFS